MLDDTDLQTCYRGLLWIRNLRQAHRQPPDPAVERAIEHLEDTLTSCASATKDAVAEHTWITTRQAAELRGCTQSYIRRIAEDLGGRKDGRDWLIPEDAL
jgi:hypothetical protein